MGRAVVKGAVEVAKRRCAAPAWRNMAGRRADAIESRWKGESIGRSKTKKTARAQSLVSLKLEVDIAGTGTSERGRCRPMKHHLLPQGILRVKISNDGPDLSSSKLPPRNTQSLPLPRHLPLSSRGNGFQESCAQPPAESAWPCCHSAGQAGHEHWPDKIFCDTS